MLNATLEGIKEMCSTKCFTGLLILFLNVACVSTQTVSRNTEPTDQASDQNYQLGAQYYRNGNFQLARDRLERAIKFDSRNASAHSLHALTMVALDNDRLATQSFDRSVRLGPNNKNIRNAYAVYLCNKARHDEGLEQFDKAIAIRENDSSWIEMTNAGVCAAKIPDLERAERYFRDALRRRPNYGEALIQMAALQHRTDDVLSARGFLQRYLGSHPPTAPVLYLGIQIETAQGDDRAAAEYEAQIRTDFPDSPEARLLRQERR